VGWLVVVEGFERCQMLTIRVSRARATARMVRSIVLPAIWKDGMPGFVASALAHDASLASWETSASCCCGP